MEISILDDDPTKIKADALVTAIGSSGMWYSATDDAILFAAGSQLHEQATRALEADPATHVIVASPLRNYGFFEHVIFVIDDFDHSLAEVVHLGLRAAVKKGFKTIVMPAIRLNGDIEVPAKLQKQRVAEILSALKEHAQDTSLDSVTVAINGNQGLFNQFSALVESP